MATYNGNANGNVITGSDDDDSIFGNNGNDTLSGGEGNDTIDGGAGDDLLGYVSGIASGVDILDGGKGRDGVSLLFDSADTHNITVDMTAAATSIGTTLFDGTQLMNIEELRELQTGAGDDTAIITLQKSTFVWDAGDGSDRFVADFSTATSPLYTFGGYGYQIQSFAGATLAALINVEAVSITGGLSNDILVGLAGDDVLNGGGGNDAIAGEDGDDALDGGTGVDGMTGGDGNDTYYVDNVGDQVNELADQGTDLVYSSVSFTLGARVEDLTLTGRGTIDGTGNSADNVLTGNYFNNILTGKSGNDYLDGGNGADTLVGGLGNDSYVVERRTDVVFEKASEGTDTVMAGFSYTLGANVENLTLTGSVATVGTGNALDNIITGSSGNNRLVGGLGADTFVFNTGSGVDRISDFSTSQGDWININAYTHGSVDDPSVTITQSGGNTLIDLGGGNTILLNGVTASDPALHSHIIW